ncbi:hypothetical protein DXA05_01675 [Bacteroides sp. AM54-2NS]|jgi:hypothetical protein|nr:hypothetical protein DXA05_01675 [Bacteroides sp. AM54-2NS]
MIYIIFAVSSRENDRECVLLNAFMYLLIKKNMNRLQTRNEILKGQRNRAYAGLHATREELERVKASNGNLLLMFSLVGLSMFVLSIYLCSNE